MFFTDIFNEAGRRPVGTLDLTAHLYRLLGFRERAYRRQAAACLNLGRGDTAVEIGCGMGRNFGPVMGKIGPSGRLVGVDLSGAMISRAGKRCGRRGWDNVELVRQDAETYRFPDSVDAVLATFALSLMPGADRVVARAAEALRPAGRLVILDLKIPVPCPNLLARFFLRLTRPAGTIPDLTPCHFRESMARRLQIVFYREYYFGLAYIATGEKQPDPVPTEEHRPIAAKTKT